MPTYEYECKKCGRRFEVFQSMKDEPLAKCERCGGRVRRLISAGAGFLFKGSGFHQTDYRSESYRKRAQADSGAPGKKEGAGKAEPGGASGAAGSGEGDPAGGTGKAARGAKGTPGEGRKRRGPGSGGGA